MMKPLVIFGTGDIAQLAHYYFSTDSDYQVVAFTVDAAFATEGRLLGLPVVPFEQVTDHYPSQTYELFVALSYAKLNEVRKSKYLAAKAMGYRLASYVSSRASILNQGQIGENCFVLEDNTIQPFAAIGNNVTLWSGNHIGHHSIIHNHCFIASHVVVSGGWRLANLASSASMPRYAIISRWGKNASLVRVLCFSLMRSLEVSISVKPPNAQRCQAVG